MKKILLLCAAGMSTSMVVKKMKESAEKKDLDVHIEAHAVDTISEYLSEYDLFLLGPQIRFKQGELQKLAPQLANELKLSTCWITA